MTVNNPPFPYKVIITRKIDQPFNKASVTDILYEGVCDFGFNKVLQMVDGVVRGRYELYLPINNIIFRYGDIVTLDMRGDIIIGKIEGYIPTNFGTTINWDAIYN